MASQVPIRAVRTFLRTSHQWLGLMTPQERAQHRDNIIQVMDQFVRGRLANLPENEQAICSKLFDPLKDNPDLKDGVDQCLRKVEEITEDRYQRSRNAKPRHRQRDAAIVRLRDEEGKTFGEIGRLLRGQDSTWTTKDGKPLTAEAVRMAYNRAKK